MDENSEKKPEAPVGNPAGTSLLVVKNPLTADGVQTYRKAEKDSLGRFQKKVKPPIPTAEFIQKRRKRLARETDGVSEDMAILEELIACMHIEVGFDNKTGLADSKMVMAKAKVAETIWLFTHGKPATAEADLAALKHSGVEFVLVQPPALNTPTVQAVKQETPKSPTFAEVLNVRTDPQK